MERTPHQGGDLQATHLHLVPPYEEQHEESHDERIIREGIERAIHDGTELDDRTARYIAAQLHEGQTSALYSLASTGAIAEEVHEELTRDFDQQPEYVQYWINWLGTYCLNRENKGAVAGWAESAAAIDRAEDEAQARQELLERISAAGVTTLGRVATVITIDDATERDVDDAQEDEPDDFPWIDAARWQPNGDVDDLARNRLDLLFAEIPDAELGAVDRMGWFGLLKHANRPGGIILAETGYGFRHVWDTTSDAALTERWEHLRCEYEAFTLATHTHESGRRGDETAPGEAESDYQPKVWVGSLSDYNNGRLHGAWLDAMLDPEELQAAIQFVLRTGFNVTAEEWAIFDYDEFCGLNLGEYESLEVVSRVAQGIAEHGEAFAKWVEYVGETSEDALSRFEESYLGQFESTEAYVEHFLEETDAYEFEEHVPEWLRPYVKVDVELLARDTEIELYVAEGREGGVFVFDPRL